MENLPHGSVYFQTIDHSKKNYKFDMSFGSDRRLTSSTNFRMFGFNIAASGARQLIQLTQLTNSIFRNGNVATFGKGQITQGLRLLPQVTSNELKISFGGIIGSILFPFGISFLLPIFSIILVQEKENRILVMMKMNGMKEWAYYLSHYRMSKFNLVTFLFLYFVNTIFFIATGQLSKLTFFTVTSQNVLAQLFLLWGIVLLT